MYLVSDVLALRQSDALLKGYRMPKKLPKSKAAATAAEIERSIQALNKMAERLWGDGREAEAKALLDALDALNRALDRIRIGESRKVTTLH
jgi:molecular chaperone GrpE (heat shock protein)